MLCIIYFSYPGSIFLYKTQINKPKFSIKSCFPNQPKWPKVISTFLFIINTQKSSSFHRLLMKKHYYSKLMEYILLFIHITQNSQSALFHDAKIPNLALFRESKIPNMRGTGPIPNEAKKIAD